MGSSGDDVMQTAMKASSTDEERVRRLKAEMTEALRRKSAADVVTLFAEESVMFVLAPR